MDFLTTKKEYKLKSKLGKFLAKEFDGKVYRNKRIEEGGYAPDYLIKKKRKTIIVIFRNTQKLSELEEEIIKNCVIKEYSVYLAVYIKDPYSEELLDELIETCEKTGIGVIRCEEEKQKRILPSARDLPHDKIDNNLIPIFISSKLSVYEERDSIHKIVKSLKHQPICVERLTLSGFLWKECKKWIDKSNFFIGIICSKYSSIVEKEIKYALKKKGGKCLIFIRFDCFSKPRKKEIQDFIEEIKDYAYCRYTGCDDLRKKVRNKLNPLIRSNLK